MTPDAGFEAFAETLGRATRRGRRRVGAVRHESTDALIREARQEDLPGLREIERRAGELFREVGMDAVADDEPPTLSELIPYVRDGRAWVATNDREVPVSYLL